MVEHGLNIQPYMYGHLSKIHGESNVVTQEVDDINIISSPVSKRHYQQLDCKIPLDQKEIYKANVKFDQIQEKGRLEKE